MGTTPKESDIKSTEEYSTTFNNESLSIKYVNGELVSKSISSRGRGSLFDYRLFNSNSEIDRYIKALEKLKNLEL